MTQPGQPGEVAAAPVSAWSPFRHRLFAAMWGAQFVSNIGGWMQTVAAQWLMLTLTGSAVYVALVQTAAGLPVVLFAILAGTIGDLVDRRRFLLLTQALMLVAAAEQFVVASWDEHLRQHERVTRRDQDRLNRIRELTDPAHPVTITHWLAANPAKARPATRA